MGSQIVCACGDFAYASMFDDAVEKLLLSIGGVFAWALDFNASEYWECLADEVFSDDGLPEADKVCPPFPTDPIRQALGFAYHSVAWRQVDLGVSVCNELFFDGGEQGNAYVVAPQGIASICRGQSYLALNPAF